MCDQSLEAEAIRSVLWAQREAWNRGDLNGYMAGCWNDERFISVSDDGITRGWLALRNRFEDAFPDPAAMGHIELEILKLEFLGDDAALVMGSVAMALPAAQGIGSFTLIMRFIDHQWRVAHDHSSLTTE